MRDLSFQSDKTSISSSTAPLHIKFALFCLNKASIPRWFGYLCFIICHIQTLVVIIKTAYATLPDNTPSSSPAIHLFVKLFVLGDWLSLRNTVPMMVGTLITTVYSIKMIGFVIYLHYALKRKLRIPGFIQIYWSMMHTIHPLVFFFWIYTFCLQILSFAREDSFNGAAEVFMTVMAYINTAISFILAAAFSIISLSYKTKDALSSKTSMLEVKTVLFKTIIPALWIISKDREGVQILNLLLCLLSSVLHDLIFVKYLPYYRITMLLLSSLIQGAQTSLALTSVIVKIIEVRGSTSTGVLSVQIVWLLVLPWTMKAYHLIAWKILMHIFSCDLTNEDNVYYLVHKRFILLYFLESRKIINEGVKKLALCDILYQARLLQVVEDCGIPFEELDKDRRLLFQNLKFICLRIIAKHPKAFLALINLAYFYSKFEDQYLVSNNLLEEAITKNPGYRAQISLQMIRYGLQKNLTIEFSQKSSTEGLDTYKYIVNHEFHQRVKDGILKQADMQLDFWKEFLSNKSKMLNLMNLALKVNNQKQVVKKLWNNLTKVKPIDFISPLTVYGLYSVLINNDPSDGEKMLEHSQEDAKRLRRFFKVDELNNHTMFSDKSVKIIMSGLKSKLGRILDCSPNISYSFGWDASELKNQPIVSIMPPFYRQRHDKFLMNHYHTGEIKILNKTAVFPVRCSNGYIRPTWIHSKVNPYMDQGISYVALMRPCRSNQRLILIRRDGKIDDMSLDFAQEMNILKCKDDPKEVDIVSLCPDFARINEAFNQMAEGLISGGGGRISPRKTQGDLSRRSLIFPVKTNYSSSIVIKNSSEGTAREVYENFITGSALVFHPRKENKNYSEPITYNVKIVNSIHDKEVIKYVMLEKIGDEAESLDDENSGYSLKMATTEYSRSQKRKGTTIKVELASPQSRPNRESLLLSSPSKHRLAFNFSDYTNDNGMSLSILDEVNSVDTVARKAVLRTIVDEHNQTTTEMAFSPSRKYNMTTIHESAVDDLGHFNSGHRILSTNETRMNLQTQFLDSIKKKQNQEFIRPNREEVPKNTMLYQREDDRNQRNRGALEIQKAESSVGSTYRSKSKRQQLIAQALKLKPRKKSTIIYSIYFILFGIAMIILLIFQNLNLNTGIKNTEGQMPVIMTAFLRQNAMISSATGLRAWKSVVQMAFSTGNWYLDNMKWRLYMRPYLIDMRDYNRQFFNLIDKLPVEARQRFYEKNVGMYDYDAKMNKTLIHMLSTTEAFQMMIEKEFSSQSLAFGTSYSPNLDISDFTFVLNNILNDLLIRSQTQINQLIEDLETSTSSTVGKMGVILGVVVAICVVSILFSVRYLFLMSSEANVFMVMIFRMRVVDCEATQSLIQHFKAAVTTDLKDFDDIVEEKSREIVDKNPNNNNNNKANKFRSASLDSLYRTQRIEFMKLLPNYLMFIAWSVVYFFLTQNFIDNIKYSEKQMSTSLQALNNQSLFVTELMHMPLTNGTAIVKNQPITPDFISNVNSLRDTSLLIEKFKDKNGELSALQQKVLFDFPCEEFLTIYGGQFSNAYSYCMGAAKGKNTIGLVNVNTQFYSVGTYCLNIFQNTPMTRLALVQLFVVGLTMSTDLIYSAEGFLSILYKATHDIFEEELNSVKEEMITFTVIILIFMLIGTAITWFLVVRKIFKLQKIDWYILQVIPIKLILSNKHVGQYLLRNSSGRLNGIKTYLS